jgi:4-hydroxyphenylpyruvate dioxygenase
MMDKNLGNNMESNSDFLPLHGTDYLEFYVGNALQAAHYYQGAFGFQPLAHRGLSTGDTELESYVVRQDKITFVFTSPLKQGTKVGEHIDKHGMGVKRIALLVPDAKVALHETTTRGADVAMPYTELSDKDGSIGWSGIKIYGDTEHYFIDRSNYKGEFLPGFEKWEPSYRPSSSGLLYVDHVVGNVGWGEMNTWVKFYKEVMGFSQIISFDDKDISTEYTALMSKVMSNGDGKVKFPINEPAKGKKKSQIEEYINFYNGAGVQHIAMATKDIIKTVSELKKNGVEFLQVPGEYYDILFDRVGEIDEDIGALKKLGILIDRDEDGYLMQIFTKPVGPRPTVFYEIIQRKGAKSFGKGNFKALFEAIELEQFKRGTL